MNCQTVKSYYAPISLTLAFLGFFFNTIATSPFDEFATITSQIGGDVNIRVKSAMSIISIGFGGILSFFGIWIKSRWAWRLNAGFGFIAWASFTVFSAYETQDEKSVHPVWWVVFAWTGVVCYALSVVFAIFIDKERRNSV